MTIRDMIKAIPGIVPVVRALRRLGRGDPEDYGSGVYWEDRYRRGGTSGAGSYNRLAGFKADFLNAFVAKHDIRSVIEYGCGDGAQLARFDFPHYVGVDVSRTVVERNAAKFAADPGKAFWHVDNLPVGLAADLTLSLDVIYHLIEDHVFDAYMRRLFDSAERFVIIYSNNVDSPWEGFHVRNRQFSDWVAEQAPQFELQSITRNPYPENPDDPENTSIADFFVYRRAEATASTIR